MVRRARPAATRLRLAKTNIRPRASPADALYLLRPDTYVALADSGGRPSALERYFVDHHLKIAANQPA